MLAKYSTCVKVSQQEGFGILGESCGLAVEYSAHDWKVVGSIPVPS